MLMLLATGGTACRLRECSDSVDVFFFQAEDGIRDLVRSRGLGDVYKRQRGPLPVALPRQLRGYAVPDRRSAPRDRGLPQSARLRVAR